MNEAGEEDDAGHESVVGQEPAQPERSEGLSASLFDHVDANGEQDGDKAAQPPVGGIVLELDDEQFDALLDVCKGCVSVSETAKARTRREKANK